MGMENEIDGRDKKSFSIGTVDILIYIAYES